MTTGTLPRPRCPRCQSRRVRFRTTTQEHVCDECGHVWPKELDKEVRPCHPSPAGPTAGP